MSFLSLKKLQPLASQTAAEFIVHNVTQLIWPKMLKLKNKFLVMNETMNGNTQDYCKLKDAFSLCCSQIKKCMIHLFDIIKEEYQNKHNYQESRDCIMDRLNWCLSRFDKLSDLFETMDSQDKSMASLDSSMLSTPIYFVDWIDHTFDVLGKLTSLTCSIVKPVEENVSPNLELVDAISDLHVSADELLLSAMTLCKYCLQDDQPAVTARCQVVLRETKALISEMIEGDLDSGYKISEKFLKLPLKPSNISVSADVLKEALYALEATTNTALLNLLLHCFSMRSPIQTLMEHFDASEGVCGCGLKVCSEAAEKCSRVKEFDLYNEWLMQIGSFALSCSAEDVRTIDLKSGLASLEALDPHLVPSIVMSPKSHHARLLARIWSQELNEIKTCIFLIVDPSAFAEKAKMILQQRLLKVISLNQFESTSARAVINMGAIVHGFFNVYHTHEPMSLAKYDKLPTLIKDLKKALNECEAVINILDENFIHSSKMQQKVQSVTHDKLVKRLKLLHTICGRISGVLNATENDENLFGNEACDSKNFTVVVKGRSMKSANSPKVHLHSSTKSVFLRSSNMARSKCIISKFTKRFKRNEEELSFSVQLDNLFNDVSPFGSGTKLEVLKSSTINKDVFNVRNNSLMYNFSPAKDRSSLRKMVLRRKLTLPQDLSTLNAVNQEIDKNTSIAESSLNLQITEILDQLNEMTADLSKSYAKPKNTPMTVTDNFVLNKRPLTQNILTLNINEGNVNETKRVWNIPVKSHEAELVAAEKMIVRNTSAENDIENKLKLCDEKSVNVESKDNTSEFDCNACQSNETVLKDEKISIESSSENAKPSSDLERNCGLNATVSRQIHDSTIEISLSNSDASQPSDVTTLERISDIVSLNNKLNDLMIRNRLDDKLSEK